MGFIWCFGHTRCFSKLLYKRRSTEIFWKLNGICMKYLRLQLEKSRRKKSLWSDSNFPSFENVVKRKYFWQKKPITGYSIVHLTFYSPLIPGQCSLLLYSLPKNTHQISHLDIIVNKTHSLHLGSHMKFLFFFLLQYVMTIWVEYGQKCQVYMHGHLRPPLTPQNNSKVDSQMRLSWLSWLSWSIWFSEKRWITHWVTTWNQEMKAHLKSHDKQRPFPIPGTYTVVSYCIQEANTPNIIRFQ